MFGPGIQLHERVVRGLVALAGTDAPQFSIFRTDTLVSKAKNKPIACYPFIAAILVSTSSLAASEWTCGPAVDFETPEGYLVHLGATSQQVTLNHLKRRQSESLPGRVYRQDCDHPRLAHYDSRGYRHW